MTQQQGSQTNYIANVAACQDVYDAFRYVSEQSKIGNKNIAIAVADYEAMVTSKHHAGEICKTFLDELKKNHVQEDGGDSESNNGFFQTIYSYVSSGWKYVESNPISSFLAVSGGLVASGYLYLLVNSSVQKDPFLKNSKVQLKSIPNSNSQSVNHLSKDKNSDNDLNGEKSYPSEGVNIDIITYEVPKTGDVLNDAASAA